MEKPFRSAFGLQFRFPAHGPLDRCGRRGFAKCSPDSEGGPLSGVPLNNHDANHEFANVVLGKLPFPLGKFRHAAILFWGLFNGELARFEVLHDKEAHVKFLMLLAKPLPNSVFKAMPEPLGSQSSAIEAPAWF